MKTVDTNRGYERKPKPRKGYIIDSYYCECGCKRGYYQYKLKPAKRKNTKAVKWKYSKGLKLYYHDHLPVTLQIYKRKISNGKGGEINGFVLYIYQSIIVGKFRKLSSAKKVALTIRKYMNK